VLKVALLGYLFGHEGKDAIRVPCEDDWWAGSGELVCYKNKNGAFVSVYSV